MSKITEYRSNSVREISIIYIYRQHKAVSVLKVKTTRWKHVGTWTRNWTHEYRNSRQQPWTSRAIMILLTTNVYLTEKSYQFMISNTKDCRRQKAQRSLHEISYMADWEAHQIQCSGENRSNTGHLVLWGLKILGTCSQEVINMWRVVVWKL
jgi:hypothetical protein